MALNRLGKDRDLRPWQIYGEGLCIVMRTGTESVSDDNTDVFYTALEAGETPLISNKDPIGNTEVQPRG